MQDEAGFESRWWPGRAKAALEVDLGFETRQILAGVAPVLVPSIMNPALLLVVVLARIKPFEVVVVVAVIVLLAVVEAGDPPLVRTPVMVPVHAAPFEQQAT